MIPQRLKNIRPYVASFIHSRFPRPPFGEMLRWVFQPGKESRALKFIEGKEECGDFLKIAFTGYDAPFYYPLECSWGDLCQTIDECCNPNNWHHFISEETPVDGDDIVVDCGAAEGLFTYLTAPTAKRVYAIEPIPVWHSGLKKMFADVGNVEILQVGAGHKVMTAKMSDAEICSKVSGSGALEVKIETIDSLFYDKGLPVTFIKADVEGFEFPLVLGAENTIRENRPKLALTVYHEANNFVEIREFLEGIHQDYQFRTRGIARNGNPILLQVY